MSPEHDALKLKVLAEVQKGFDWPDWLVSMDFDPETKIFTLTVSDREAVADQVASMAIDIESVLPIPDILIEIEESPPVELLLSGQAHLPVPPSGPTTGGDPIWHGDNGWGTLALASPQITIIDHEGNPQVVANALLGCNHILALLDQAQDGDAIGLYRTPGSATLNWHWKVTDAAVVPVDIALAEHSTPADLAMREVRGLGPVTSVAAPVHGERLFKCGARTSITTALDDGWETVMIGHYGNRQVNLRKTRPDFADVGDSGAAVLNEARQLVGIVIAGAVKPHGYITYYLPTIPLNAPQKPVDTLYLELEI
jgi:hypothetical protein